QGPRRRRAPARAPVRSRRARARRVREDREQLGGGHALWAVVAVARGQRRAAWASERRERGGGGTMSAERITRILVARVMAVLVLHAAILWMLLPKHSETYSIAAGLFGIAAGVVGLALVWLDRLRRDALS